MLLLVFLGVERVEVGEDVGERVGKMGVILRGSIEAKAQKRNSGGSRGDRPSQRPGGHGRLAQLVRAWC